MKTLLNVSFTIVNEQSCKAALGNYTIGIFEILKEDYDCLEKIWSIVNRIESLSSICIDNKIYPLKFYNGGDLKFLLNIYGNIN